MKKLFISLPMRGRSNEDIKRDRERMHKIAEAYFGEELEVIDSFLEGADYKGQPFKCLGESIKRMQEADYLITVEDSWAFPGIQIEGEVFYNYKADASSRIIRVDGRILFPEVYRERSKADTPVTLSNTPITATVNME